MKRYKADDESMVAYAYGDWVLYSDATALQTEIDQAIGILYGGLDRDRDKSDTLRTLCVVLVNAINREREKNSEAQK